MAAEGRVVAAALIPPRKMESVSDDDAFGTAYHNKTVGRAGWSIRGMEILSLLSSSIIGLPDLCLPKNNWATSGMIKLQSNRFILVSRVPDLMVNPKVAIDIQTQVGA